MPRRIIFFFLFLLVACSKNSLEYEEIPETLLFSCIDYSKVTDPNFDSDDLYAFWNIFVEDAKCSMSNNPDYDKLNSVVDIFYEYESAALTASGEVLHSGIIEDDNNNGCSPYCGTMYCVPTDECVTVTTGGGSWSGYINISEPSSNSNCNGCTDYLAEVYSDSSTEICVTDDSGCADGEESIYTYGSCDDISYTITYSDGTVLDMLYNTWIIQCSVDLMNSILDNGEKRTIISVLEGLGGFSSEETIKIKGTKGEILLNLVKAVPIN